MTLFLGALLAGVLTTLAPCVLPLLPVIVGGSVPAPGEPRPWRRALVVTAALGASVVVFTLLLKATTALIAVPTAVWSTVSGGLLILLGLVAAFPGAWARISGRLGFEDASTGGLAAARTHNGTTGLILTGAALGPVFSSCSPFYAYIVVTALPAEPGTGLALLLAYVLGLCGTLLAVALAGQRLVQRLGFAADPSGWLRRGLGWLFVAVGLAVLTGFDRTLQTWLIDNAPVAPWLLDTLFVPA